MNGSLPVELLLGLYLGALTGVVPALVAWGLGFAFRYVTGVTLPGFAVVVLGVAIAGVQGGLLGLIDPSVVNSPAAVVALVVVMMAVQYSHAKGDAMGATFPRRVDLRRLAPGRLSADVVERVGDFGQVRVRVAGEVGDVEGHPPLPEDLRTAIREGEWTFPADLPLSELETRLADRLRTDYDLEDVAVSIDSRGRASVAAAPPAGSLSRRVPAGQRAVSVPALVPTGLARGDEVVLSLPDRELAGTVVSARSDGVAPAEDDGETGTAPTTDDGTAADVPDAPARTPTTTGGEGRVTVAVPRTDATAVLDCPDVAVRVRSRGTRREYELQGLLRRAGNRFRKLAVRAGGPLDGTTLGDAGVRERYDVAVLAVRRSGEWTVAPRGPTALSAGDELFAVGPRSALDRFAEAVA
ncbi:potassium transporter TrkA [halophilic archaeon]|nr:potassium transporter TrkA [halophilic archaeon]